jgi:hypothetical protein
MADILSDITGSPFFLIFFGIIIGAVIMYLWSKRQKELPEQKVGYGMKVWADILHEQVPEVMNKQATRPHNKKIFYMGNEPLGRLLSYIYIAINPIKQVDFKLSGESVVNEELKKLKEEMIYAESERLRKAREVAAGKGTAANLDM